MRDERREKRSTAMLYGEEHWKEAGKKYKTTFTEDDETVKREAEKKRVFIEKHLMKEGKLLDVGCSFGFFVLEMRNHGWEAFGIDTSEYALEMSPERIKPFLVRTSVVEMKLPEDEFDVVTAFDVLEHLYIEEILEAVKRISKVCRKYILIRLPVQSPYQEVWLTDISFKVFDKGHISIYPYPFWVRRFEEVGKFERWFAHIYKGPGDDSDEAWLVFRRKG